MKKGKKKTRSREEMKEVIGICLHPSIEHKALHLHVSREKAHRKCLKEFNNPCKYFVKKEGSK